MITTGEILRKFRSNRQFTQKKLSNGIISRQTYSKIEHGDIEPNFEILNSLLEKLDYSLSDFAMEHERLKNDTKFFHIYQKGVAKEASHKEISNLVEYVKQNYKKSKKNFYLYCITKGQLFTNYPDLIPKFTSKDKNYFKKILLTEQRYFSLYDLKLIGNFAVHLLDYKDLLHLYSILPDFSPYDYGDNVELYHSEINRIYNNFCDIAIYNNDLETANFILNKHLSFTKNHKNFRNNLFIEINKLSIKFKESKDTKFVLKLKSMSKNLNSLGEKQLSQALEYQIKVLETDSEYISFKAITHN